MRHTLFPTRKASKLTFVCFQLQLFSTMQGLTLKINLLKRMTRKTGYSSFFSSWFAAFTIALFEVACLSKCEMCGIHHYAKSYDERLIFKLKHCDIAR